MAETSWRQASRLEWAALEELVTVEHVIAGSLQRIADAMEPFSAEYKKATQAAAKLNEELIRERRAHDETKRILAKRDRGLRRALKRIAELEAE